MRPVYEQAWDRTAELTIADRIHYYWSVTPIKSKKFGAYDFMLKGVGKEVLGMCEIKARTCTKEAFKTYIISYDKWQHGLLGTHLMKLPHLLCIGWRNIIGWIEVRKDIPVNYIHGGRADRNDPQDMEVMVEIPISHFHHMHEKPHL